ncbi:MAG: 6-carboxytetrahydropterin synthase [Bacteroidota bacterium]|jgi:6-pyruvoyltetrahydropterin/6-carboxytetrahydropterin synthase|nr:6-carboxytetrahydropterin synthase [Ignavibacteria bacterium]MCU7497766.1 6-carboxytetrahydropterin synthase [Ignavibacteria bacterium]MCU7503943.1 6-carboxytetrahydropterin synthase [Ignavibacteria bacterium]MCU7510929.1 6-carboxytetrahydropterin synthase [Ignavibacteria bacterium]MCU7515836.1 6-carboxytetrahydropterin synthase [Ignavibacteria bacterium]
MLYVTRREVFSASHRLHNPKLDDNENRSIYGKCNNQYGHGHNYILEVVIAGETDPKTGYLIDIKCLKEIILRNVIDKVDHKHLNYEVDFLKGIIPTTENLAVAIWKELKDKITSGRLFSVKLYETENNYVEYKGE